MGKANLKANIRYLILSTQLLTAFGCSSLGGYNLPNIQKEFHSTIQRNENLVSRANGDFVEKKVLIETLAKSGQANWPKASGELNLRLEEMNTILPKVNRAKAQMSELNGQLSALSYNRTKVRRDDEAYDRADQIVKEFDLVSQQLSDQLNAYTRASNSFSDVVAKNGLFTSYDLGAFQKRIQAAIGTSNATIRDMNAELARSERILNLSDPNDQLAEPQAIFVQLGASAKDFGAQAQRLPELSSKVKESTMANAKISSADPNWQQVQKLLSELEDINTKLGGIKTKFHNLNRDLQSSLKKFRK